MAGDDAAEDLNLRRQPFMEPQMNTDKHRYQEQGDSPDNCGL